MDINSWNDTWGRIDWEKDPEDKIKQKITEFYHAGVDFNMGGKYDRCMARPLDFAAQYSTVGVIDLLIDGGADITLVGEEGWTVLHSACFGGKMENLKYLVEHGPSDKAIFINKPDADGDTVLLWMAKYGGPEKVQALIEAGADVNKQDKRGCTALLWAAYNDHIETVKVLVEAGADVNIKDDDGKTALDVAADETIKQLIKNADQIRAEYLKNHPQGSLQQTLGKASVKTDKMSLVKDPKTR